MKRFSFVPETNGDLRRARVSQVCSVFVIALLVVFTLILGERGDSVRAQSSDPTMTVPNLAVRTATSGLITPISIAFLGTNDLFVLEKNTGKVKRVVNGAVQSTVL